MYFRFQTRQRFNVSVLMLYFSFPFKKGKLKYSIKTDILFTHSGHTSSLMVGPIIQPEVGPIISPK